MSADKYRELRERATQAALDCVGLPWADAVGLCAERELACRVLNVDGRAAMITADVRMDRVQLCIRDGIVTEANCG